MNKIAVVFWSGTGNTEMMADSVIEGIESTGAEYSKFNASEFNCDMTDDFDAIAFGCPAMGCEELEDCEFEPMFNSCEPKLKGKKVALFGSYGWGNGEWMEKWKTACINDGAILISEPVICVESPDDDTSSALKWLGKSLI